MDQQDKDRAALNIKFEYERAKRLTAAERGTQIHAEIEQALNNVNPELQHQLNLRAAELQRVAMQSPTPAYIVRGEFHAGAKLRALIDAQNAMLQETADDIRAQHNPQLDWYRDPMVTMVTPAEHKPSILKLTLSLTVRFLLVLGAAVLVLAMVAK